MILFFLSWNIEIELKWNFSFELYFKMYILIYPKKKKSIRNLQIKK